MVEAEKKMNAIVTKQSLQEMLENPNKVYVMHVVGHALKVLFDRQTKAEKEENTTKFNNNIGFTGADGRSGALSAKSYLKNKKLEDWQVEKWLRRDKTGYSRITKYHKQLNEAALEKQGK